MLIPDTTSQTAEDSTSLGQSHRPVCLCQTLLKIAPALASLIVLCVCVRLPKIAPALASLIVLCVCVRHC